MKFKKHEISTLHKMLTQIQSIKKELSEFSEEKQEFILNLHNEEATLQYCLRWSEEALYDVIKEVEE